MKSSLDRVGQHLKPTHGRLDRDRKVESVALGRLCPEPMLFFKLVLLSRYFALGCIIYSSSYKMIERTGWVPESEMENRTDSQSLDVGTLMLHGVRPAALALASVALMVALAYVVWQPAVWQVLVPIHVALAVFFMLIRWLVDHHARRMYQKIPLLGGILATFVVVDCAAHLVLMRVPLLIGVLALSIVGAGFLVLWRWWLLALIGVAGGAWLWVAWTGDLSVSWMQFGALLSVSAGLSLLVHVARLRTYRHLAELQKVANDRSEALRRRARQLETLISVSHGINAFYDIDTLLEYVVETLHAGFGYHYVGVFLVDDAGIALESRAGTGEVGKRLTAEGRRLEIGGGGLVGWASQHNEAVCVNDVRQDPRYREDPILPNTRAEMVVPLRVGHKLIGILDVQSPEVDAFNEDDLQVCQALADQIAVAIQNVSRYQVEHTRRLISETLYEVGRALPQTLDVSKVLDLILESLGRIVWFDRAAVLLRRGNILRIVAARGFPEASDPLAVEVPVKPDDVFDRIYRMKAPLVLQDVSGRLDWEYVEGLPLARTWLGLPLLNAEDEVVGMLSLVRESPAPFSEDEVALGIAFAGQAGAALHNARLYRELSQAYRRLERLDRAKTSFISLASHELRTPLTLITGYSHMLLDEPGVAESQAMMTMVNGLVLGSARLQAIVDRMMDLAEIESESLQLQFAPLALHPLMEEVVKSLSEALKTRHLDLQLDDMSGCPEIEGDRESLHKAFRHLVSNAIKFTPDGGHIRISAVALPSDSEHLGEPCVHVTVADTGIGIDPEYQDSVFETFFQIGDISLHSSGEYKFRGGGPGIGLAIVKGIVEAHRGRIWVESPGCDVEACPGSTFHVVLPLTQPALKKAIQDEFLKLRLDELWSRDISVEDTIQFLMSSRKSP